MIALVVPWKKALCSSYLLSDIQDYYRDTYDRTVWTWYVEPYTSNCGGAGYSRHMSWGWVQMAYLRAELLSGNSVVDEVPGQSHRACHLMDWCNTVSVFQSRVSSCDRGRQRNVCRAPRYPVSQCIARNSRAKWGVRFPVVVYKTRCRSYSCDHMQR